MNPVRLVTFDVTNTLLQFRTSVGDVYSKAAKLNGLHTPLNNLVINNSFKKNFKSLLVEYPNFGAQTSLSSEAWWSIVVERTLTEAVAPALVPKNQLEDISNHLFKLYSTEICWTVLPGAVGLIEKIKSKGIYLGVISNFDERLTNVLKAKDLYTYFDFILASFVEKVQKPDKCIFDLALQRMSSQSILAKECVHIGDDFVNDYEGAKNAGWNALFLTKSHKPMNSVEEIDVVRNVADIESKIFGPGMKKSLNSSNYL